MNVLLTKPFDKVKHDLIRKLGVNLTIIDENEIYLILYDGRLAGAALDVFEQEPYNGPLKELDNVEIKSFDKIPPTLFRMNPAKDKIIFKNEGVGSHTYFKVDEAYEVLKTNNFNMDVNFTI